MQSLTKSNITNIAYGAALLGSGGGGNSFYSSVMAQNQIEKYGPVKLLSLDELKSDDLIIPIGFMGAPLITLERLPNELELESVIESISQYYKKKPKALAISEIGGANVFTPFLIAQKLNLPVVDADLIGRAFPELQMVSLSVHDTPIKQSFMSDIFGNTIIIQANDLKFTEKYARTLTIAFGSSAVVVLHVLSGIEAKKVMIPNTLQLANSIGELLNKENKHLDPIDTILSKFNGEWIGKGIVTNIQQKLINGFLKGIVTICCGDNTNFQLHYQNEYLFIYKDGVCIAKTPDIIAILDDETNIPITSESIQFGLRVNIITLKSNPIWYTAKGLSIVGPEYFRENYV